MEIEISPAKAGLGKLKKKSGLSFGIMPYLFLIPALALLLVFRYFPAFSAIYHSFTDWDGTRPANFVGLQQYRAMFQDEVFLLSLKNIIVYTFARTLISLVMAIIGAELVYNLRSQRAGWLWRIVFTVPLVIPATVVFLIWRRIYAGRLGLVNEF